MGCNAFNLWLAETRVDGRVVFKPLCIFRDGLCTSCGYRVFIFDEAFPCAFQAEGISVDLNESIDEVDTSFLLFQPFDGILVKRVRSPVV